MAQSATLVPARPAGPLLTGPAQGRTGPARASTMHGLPAVDHEPIPGYRLLEPLGRGGFGEVWKCRAPGGMCKAIKFVQGGTSLHQDADGAARERRALDAIKGLRHPFLLSLERVEVVDGDLVVVTELADRSLHELLAEHKQRGMPGVPRAEALAYLREAAEVLDFLNLEHGLQHLDIKPRNLFLVGRHVKVADFGLVASLAEITGSKDLLSNITPLYAAPEIFAGRATLFSDQYSLAVTYHELVTGAAPFHGLGFSQLAYLVSTTDPDLSKLPAHDRPAVARAMSREPRERFPSCLDFLDALADASPSPPGAGKARSTSFEFTLGEMTPTADLPAVGRSTGVYRRATRVVPAGQAPVAPAGGEPLAGFQLLECLGRGQAGELWRARSPRGEPRLVRFLVTPAGDGPRGDPLARLKKLRHPVLAKVEAMTIGPDRTALVSEFAEGTLADLLKECRAAGRPGIPRADLLGYLGAVAQALDEMYHAHQLQHLALTPRHVGVRNGEPLLVEFGQAELLWLPDGIPPGSLAPRYAAVEMFEGLISDACDQYSLALMFQELLVGVHPYRNLNARQMASPKLRGQPDLALLPGPDRPIILRALDPAPERRFRSCAELISALEEVTFQAERAAVAVAPAAHPARGPQPPGRPIAPLPEDWRPALEELVHAAERGQQVLSSGPIHYRLTPGVAIEQRCRARLAPGMARLKMAGFREQWRAELIDESPSRWRYAVKTSASLMERCLGRSPSLLVEVVLGAPRDTTGNLTPVRITVEPADCGRGRAGQVLEHVGPMVLASLQKYLGSQCEREEQERYPLAQAVELHAPAAGLRVPGRLRDIGRQGLAVVAEAAVPAGAVTVTMNRWASPVTLQASGWVCDCLPDGNQFELEIVLGG